MLNSCIICTKNFKPINGIQKCCSEECSKLNRIKYDKAKHSRYKIEKPKFKKVCLACGNTFETTNQKQVFCSTKCAATKVQNKISIKKCITCGNDYEGKQGNLYCSDACKPKINHTCEQCGKEYKTEGRISKYCSNKCVADASTKHNAVCLNCGKEFTSVLEEPRKFCCRDCFLESIGAVKWETKREWELSDASSIRRAKRYGVKYEHIIPVEIFKRDNWICRLCGVGVSHTLAYPHPMSASLNHIIPLSKNGTHTTDNVQLAHMGCSLRKSNKYEGEVFNANINEKNK